MVAYTRRKYQYGGSHQKIRWSNKFKRGARGVGKAAIITAKAPVVAPLGIVGLAGSVVKSSVVVPAAAGLATLPSAALSAVKLPGQAGVILPYQYYKRRSASKQLKKHLGGVDYFDKKLKAAKYAEEITRLEEAKKNKEAEIAKALSSGNALTRFGFEKSGDFMIGFKKAALGNIETKLKDMRNKLKSIYSNTKLESNTINKENPEKSLIAFTKYVNNIITKKVKTRNNKIQNKKTKATGKISTIIESAEKSRAVFEDQLKSKQSSIVEAQTSIRETQETLKQATTEFLAAKYGTPEKRELEQKLKTLGKKISLLKINAANLEKDKFILEKQKGKVDEIIRRGQTKKAIIEKQINRKYKTINNMRQSLERRQQRIKKTKQNIGQSLRSALLLRTAGKMLSASKESYKWDAKKALKAIGEKELAESIKPKLTKLFKNEYTKFGDDLAKLGTAAIPKSLQTLALNLRIFRKNPAFRRYSSQDKILNKFITMVGDNNQIGLYKEMNDIKAQKEDLINQGKLIPPELEDKYNILTKRLSMLDEYADDVKKRIKRMPALQPIILNLNDNDIKNITSNIKNKNGENISENLIGDYLTNQERTIKALKIVNPDGSINPEITEDVIQQIKSNIASKYKNENDTADKDILSKLYKKLDGVRQYLIHNELEKTANTLQTNIKAVQNLVPSLYDYQYKMPSTKPS